MAIDKVELKNVITGTKQKYFELNILDNNNNVISSRLYIANIEKDGDNLDKILTLNQYTPTSQLTNICNVFNTANNTYTSVIKNMFDITNNNDFIIRSYAYANKNNLTLNSSEDYSDLFISNSYNPQSLVSYGDSLFVLTDKLSSLVYYSINDVNGSSMTSSTISDPIYTAVFKSSAELSGLSVDEFSNSYIPKFLVKGIPYNHVIEFPNSIYPLFKDNTLLGNAVICKNHLGYDYSQHSITNDGSAEKTKYQAFSELRSYNRILTSGDSVYLVYKNDTKCNTGTYSTNYTITDGYELTVNSDDIISNNTFSSTDFSDSPNYSTGSIEKVEILKSINRYQLENKYKSNLYSIEIDNLGLNELDKTSNNDIKSTISNIKKSITNNIKKICENIQPGNTQLFSVFFTGN